MATLSAQRQLSAFLAKYSPEIARLARRALAKLRARLPGAHQLVYDNFNALAIGFAPSERASEAILSIAVYPRWVSLFFLQGAGLPDPEGLLRGSGTRVRHLVLESADQLDSAPVARLLSAALARAKRPIPPDGAGRLIIKSVSAKQRPRRYGAPPPRASRKRARA